MCQISKVERPYISVLQLSIQIFIKNAIWIMQQVFEFLEDISASLTNMADRELTVLKDLKVQISSVHF